MEEISDMRWQEICRWAEEEWVGGASVTTNREMITFWSAVGTMILKFHAYKHNPGEPRTLYQIDLTAASYGTSGSFPMVFPEGTEIPATLDDFLLLYARKREEEHTTAKTLRQMRQRIKLAQKDEGYPSMAEVYAYVISQLREPVAHEELHTDTSEYEESAMREAGKAPSEKRMRTLALFLQWVRAFKPDFRHWANLGEVFITADHPAWKVGGGGILKIASDLCQAYPMEVLTGYGHPLPMRMPNGYSRDMLRVPDIKQTLKQRPGYQTSLYNYDEAAGWTGPVFIVGIAASIYHERKEATKSLRFRFKEPYEVPSVESLAEVHPFKKLSSGQIADVEVFARTAEAEGLDNPVGRAAAIRQGTMGYADSKYEHLYLRLEDPIFKESVVEGWDNFGDLFAPPEHHELHTDTSGYEEAVSPIPSRMSNTFAIPEDARELEEAAKRWESYPESRVDRNRYSQDFGANFVRVLQSASGRGYQLIMGLFDGQPLRVGIHPVHLPFDDFRDWYRIPGDPEYIYAQMLKHCREDSDAFVRLKGVRPATAAHWEKQFLLGISLEKKVPETAFPKRPVIELPPYFKKFLPAVESDLGLIVQGDLSLLGE